MWIESFPRNTHERVFKINSILMTQNSNSHLDFFLGNPSAIMIWSLGAFNFMLFENYKMRKQWRLHTSKAADRQQLRSWTVTPHHTKQVSAEHDPPATSSPWSTSCHGSGPCHGSWWDSSCPEHPRRWVWTYGRPPRRSAGQQGSPHTRAPWDHLRRFLKDGRKCRGQTTAMMSSHRWTHILHVFH